MTKGAHRFPHVLAVDLTGYSECVTSTLSEVVEHTCQIIFSEGQWEKYAGEALKILLSLIKKSQLLIVDTAWIGDLLKRAVLERMPGNKVFIIPLRLSALREAATNPKPTGGQIEADPRGIVTWENPIPEYTLLDRVSWIIKIHDAQEDGW